MLNPGIVIPHDKLILEPALYVNLPSDLLILLLVLPAKLNDFDTVDIAIDFISDFEHLAAATLSKERQLFEVLSVSFIWYNIEPIGHLLGKLAFILIQLYILLFVFILLNFIRHLRFENSMLLVEMLAPLQVFIHLFLDVVFFFFYSQGLLFHHLSSLKSQF